MVATLRNDATALSAVKKWADKFKRRRESLEDVPKSGRLSTAITQKNIDRINQMMMDDIYKYKIYSNGDERDL